MPPYFALWLTLINPNYLYFYGSKGVRTIVVLLYLARHYVSALSSIVTVIIDIYTSSNYLMHARLHSTATLALYGETGNVETSITYSLALIKEDK